MRRLAAGIFVLCITSLLGASLSVSCSSSAEPTPLVTVTPPTQSTATPIPQPTATPTPEPLQPDEVLQIATEALESAGSLWFVLDHENGFTEALGGLELQHIEGAINETAMSITAEANLGRIYIEVDAILMGRDTWLTNPLTGIWELLPQDENPVGFLQPIAAVRDVLASFTEPEFMETHQPGEDYRVKSPLLSDGLRSLLGEIKAGSIGIGEVVIDHRTFQMKSARITGAMQNRDTDQTVRIIELSRYGETFIIEPPIIE